MSEKEIYQQKLKAKLDEWRSEIDNESKSIRSKWESLKSSFSDAASKFKG